MTEHISVFGLGYVGLITSLGLADQGHRVVGVEIAEDKVEKLNDTSPTIQEPGVEQRLSEHVQSGRFRAVTDAREGIRNSSISIICVGTPTDTDGSIDLRAVENVVRQIGQALQNGHDQHTVLLRSTVLPGTSTNVVNWLEDTSGRNVPDDVAYIYQPEFMREGTAFDDFYDPPFTVYGPPTDHAERTIKQLYPDVDAPRVPVQITEAESIKYACNAFHAVKISFANEIGRLSAHHNIDGKQIMDVLCRDRTLNISDAYLEPGSAFGGSCLPKDLKALCRHARKSDRELPLIQSVIESNNQHLDFMYDRIVKQGGSKLGVIGLTFKPGTDDVRESPMVKLCARITESDDVDELFVYEPTLNETELHGSNRLFLEQTFSDYRDHLVDHLEELVQSADTLVLGSAAVEYEEELAECLPADVTILDTTGRFDSIEDRQSDGMFQSLL